MNAEIGKISDLEMVRTSPHGVYLKFGKEEILMPNKYVPEGLEPGQSVSVFVYKDSEDRLVATNLTPAGILGDYVALEVVEIAPFGAFMEWGLEKHLLVPNAEMGQNMETGNKYVVRIMLDYKTERLIGVGKIEGFLDVPDNLNEGDEVRGIVYKKTDLGFNVVVDSQFNGLIYHNSIFEPIQVGQSIKCYIDKVRTDGKVDLKLRKGGLEDIDENAQKLLDYLKSQGGSTPLTDKSAPADIQAALGLSKKAFKKAVGSLYRKHLIVLAPEETSLIA
jgi:predicted RNA-binding protein (virulence factor B family)